MSPYSENPIAASLPGNTTDSEWRCRCFAWMVGMAPVAEDEAEQIVYAASTIPSYRNMAPEDAALRLLDNTAIRPSRL